MHVHLNSFLQEVISLLESVEQFKPSQVEEIVDRLIQKDQEMQIAVTECIFLPFLARPFLFLPFFAFLAFFVAFFIT